MNKANLGSNLGMYAGMPDEQILERSLIEPELFSVLVDRYQASFRQAARRILGTDDAEDAVQESFVRIYIHARKYTKKDGAKFSSWAYSILTRVCFTIYSRNKRKYTFTLDPEVVGEIEDFSARELREYGFDASYLLSLISKLPVLLRRTVELYVFDHKTEKEIAKIENVSYGVVRTRLSRARSKLRQLDVANAALFKYD
ncbi:MAG: RNA polymerase sigma factor [Patescibacteria group bacterium]|nr:RNA polymerase sigma factor [Patescibacteria group bacterium]MDE1940937.1 RNA polymerase sigma factor [Patescibacteria group bacterium]MDE1966689.1 RNA polymerase sigma factor [Patescibacteria group bacterium]